MSQPVRIRFVGSGDAFGSGGRLQACIHVAWSQGNCLLDCGCSSLIGLRRCKIAVERVDTVLVSHLHGDHFGGIPFLLLDGKYRARRQDPLTIIGPPGLQTQVEAALDAFYPGTRDSGFGFPLTYLELDPERTLQHGALAIRAWRMQHGSSGAFGLQVAVDGKRIAYSGDTEWTENLLPLAAGADLLICECFQYDQPIPSHLDYLTLRANRSRLDCRQLVLTHAGEELLQRQSELEFPLAHDGYSLEL
jgi:ribonuclease BN (tRNA processing enzyme)